MAKVYTDIRSLSESLKPEIRRLNDIAISDAMSDIESQASKLLNDVNSLWAGYERSYSPSMYVRTGATRGGFSLSDSRIVQDGLDTKVEIDLILDDDAMYHDSIFGSHYTQGHSFMLISEGWRSARLEAYRGPIYRLTYYEGYGIIDTLVGRHNTSNYDFKFYHEGREV